VAGSSVSLAFFRFGQERLVLQCFLKGSAQDEDSIPGRAGGSASGRANAAAFWMPTLIS